MSRELTSTPLGADGAPTGQGHAIVNATPGREGRPVEAPLRDGRGGLNKGIVVSTGGFRSGAERAAQELSIDLWGPDELAHLLGAPNGRRARPTDSQIISLTGATCYGRSPNMEPLTCSPGDASRLLASFANAMEASVPVLAAFVAATVEVGRGENGLEHLASQVASGRTRVSDWFEAMVTPDALEVLRLAEDAGDLVSGARLAAAASGARLYS